MLIVAVLRGAHKVILRFYVFHPGECGVVVKFYLFIVFAFDFLSGRIEGSLGTLSVPVKTLLDLTLDDDALIGHRVYYALNSAGVEEGFGGVWGFICSEHG